ncbi:MAG: PQQ-dependent sugar dehydrogenase, partial [Bryobacteraceae bacterium]
LFFVQQNGIVRVFRDGALAAAPFLDIRARTRGEGESGLLGMAFPPGFARSRRFYVNYTDLAGDTIVAQYRVSSNPDVADAASEVVLLKIDQPYDNHNGGGLRFGPDGFLYIGMGDGGSGGDPHNYGQRLDTLLGKMLRIDVESDPGRVRAPPGNPFASTPGARPEIWSIGLRNPWRFSFDRATGDLWIGDVGQESYEEVNFTPAARRGGENYGWNPTEGSHCFQPECDRAGLTLPMADYSHAEGCSVTGGFVYRGRLSPGLRGVYVYGDFCSGRIWGVGREGSAWVNRRLLDSGLNITTFGEDEAGELYLADQAGAAIYRVDGPRAPRFSAADVVNAASLAGGLVAGSLGTVFVAGVLDDPAVISADGLPLPTRLNGVSVTVNGIPAPIVAVANQHGREQVNFQAPFEIAGSAVASIVVTRAGQSSRPVEAPVFEVQPAIYTVVHADYTPASAARPLERDQVALLYATGLGAVTNQPSTGAASPASALASTETPARVSLAGLRCPVEYSGLAPGLVGVYQVNFRVP